MSIDNDDQKNGLALAAGITEEHINNLLAEYDEFHNLILLLYRVNNFQPRNKWIQPIMCSCEYEDFKSQLLLAIEDYGEKQE